MIIIIRWIIASIVTKVVVALLNPIKFNGLAERSGFASFVSNMGLKSDSVGFIGLIVKRFIRLIVLIAAFDSLGLPQVSDVLRQFVLWIPNLIVALIILVIGGLAANALASLEKWGSARGSSLLNLLRGYTAPSLWC